MSRRVKFFIAIGIVIILGILFALGLRGRRMGEIGTNSISTRQTAETAKVATPATAVPVAPLDAKQRAELTLELSIETLARSFTERYGSYSNQNQFENIKDLYPFMTDGLRDKSVREIEQAQESITPSAAIEYSGVTTRAMSVKIEERTDASARTVVQTQRKEIRAAEVSPRIYYQEIILVFVKDGGQWKVDQAQWK